MLDILQTLYLTLSHDLCSILGVQELPLPITEMFSLPSDLKALAVLPPWSGNNAVTQIFLVSPALSRWDKTAVVIAIT